MNVNTQEDPLANLDAHGSGNSIEDLEKRLRDDATWDDVQLPPLQYIVNGLIAKNDMFAIIGKSKSGKSFLAMQMALCIAYGKPFLNLDTTPCKVLYVNCEVKEVVFRNRRKRMESQLNITTRKRETLKFLNVPDSYVGWEDILTICKNQRFDVVFADPFYQISNINENDQSACNEVINTIKRFKAEGITLIVLFHAPKGFEGDKPLIDLVSGHGVLTRSPDGMCGILNHSNNKSSRVFRTELRNDAPLEDFTITLTDGIWEVNNDVSPTVATARSHAQNANNNKVSNDAIDEGILDYIEQMQKEDGYDGLGISIGDFVPSVKEAMEGSALTVSEKRIKKHLKRLNKEKKLYIEEKSGVQGGIKFVGELAIKTRWEEKKKAKEAKGKQNTKENETEKKAKK